MNAFARLASDAYLATQKRAVQSCARTIQEAWGIDFDRIRTPRTCREYAARDALICALANIGLSIREMSSITQADHHEVEAIVSARRNYGVPIRTTKWEAA